MKIGFDTSQTGSVKAGCGYFADGLIRQLSADDTRNEYILYSAVGDLFWDPDHPGSTFSTDRKSFQHWKAPIAFDASRQFWRNPGKDFEGRLGNPDVFHSNNFFCPMGLEHARLVYTLYDLSFIENPDWNTEEHRIGCFSGMFRASVNADLIVAISEYTRQHFLSNFPWYPASRMAVVYPASRFEPGCESQPIGRLPALKPGGFWLSVGTIEPRKNHGRLLDAYRILKAEDEATLPLVMAGGQGWLLRNLDTFLHGLEPQRDIILPGYVSDEELKWLYRNCFGFVYPSLFEGFGMPVLEALGFGAPVLCASTSSLPEAAGTGALFFDPLDSASIAAVMQRLARGDVNRESLISLGFKHAKRFSWGRSAAELRELYEQVAAQPRLWPAQAVKAARQGAEGSHVL